MNLGASAIRQEFLRHIGNEYEGVIDSDIAGDNAKSQRLDREHKSWNHLAERNATSIFLHSFAADQQERGIELPHIKLDVTRSDTPVTLVTDVLEKQRRELWYLNTRNGQEHYFSNVPNLNRMVIDKKAQVQPSAVRKELKSRIQNELGTKLETHPWPSSGEEIPDNQELKLIVLDPEETYDDRTLRQWIDKKGQSYRTYKNTIIFAVPDEDRHVRFEDAIKQYLALREIYDGIERGDYPALEKKKKEIKRRMDNLIDDFPRKVRELYHVAKVPVMNGDRLEEIDFGQPAVGRENLDSWFRRTLSSQMHGKVLDRPPSANLIEAKFLSNTDTIALSDVLEQFHRDPSLPALDKSELIAETIANGVKDGRFGLARREDDELIPSSVKIHKHYSRTQVHFHEEGWVLVSRSTAEELQRDAQPETPPPEDPEEPATGPPSGDGEQPGGPSGERETTSQEDEEKVHRLHLKASGIPSGRLHDLNRGVLLPITRATGEFELTVEFEVESTDGISKKAIEQTVMETLRQLGATVERREAE